MAAERNIRQNAASDIRHPPYLWADLKPASAFQTMQRQHAFEASATVTRRPRTCNP